MFGFAGADPSLLTPEERGRYRAVYCGLCRALGEDRPFYFRAALTYDFVLPVLLRSAAEETAFTDGSTRCGVHPFKKHALLTNRHTRYAADMNALLAFYKNEDDLADEGGVSPRLIRLLLKTEAARLSADYPEQSAAIKTGLAALSELEAADERDPSKPAAVFGNILGAVFAAGAEAHRQTLFDFGSALGRAVYLMDAAVDLKDDLRKKRYNPLVALGFEAAALPIKTELSACLAALGRLPPSEDVPLIKNVLLAGIWARYDRKKDER